MFFLNVQSFLRPVCFEKKIGSVSLKRQLKRREEIWITKRTLWCYFQVYLSQKKRKGAEQRQCFKATHFIKRPSFQGQGVDLDTNIEGRIQENVRIVFTSKNNEMWLNIFFFFFSSSIAHLQIYRHIMRNWIKSIHILYADFFPLLLTMSSNGKPTTYPNDLKTKMQISYSYAKPQGSFLWHISKVFVNNLKEKSCSDIT